MHTLLAKRAAFPRLLISLMSYFDLNASLLLFPMHISSPRLHYVSVAVKPSLPSYHPTIIKPYFANKNLIRKDVEPG